MIEGKTQPLWMLRTVVTGGAGFVGARVCERLLELGAHVQCVDDLTAADWQAVEHLRGHPRFTALPTDLRAGLPVSGSVDWVLHLSWSGSPVDPRQLSLGTMQLGCVGTQRALDLATEQDARFLLASTATADGEPETFVEALSASYRSSLGVDTGIIRVFDTFGPRMPLDNDREVSRFVRQALAGEPLAVSGDGSRVLSLCYVDDAADGIVAMAGDTTSGPLDLGGERVTERELAEQVLRLSGSDSPILLTGRPAGGSTRPPDRERTQRVLGWSPSVGLTEGLVRTLSWARLALVAGA